MTSLNLLWHWRITLIKWSHPFWSQSFLPSNVNYNIRGFNGSPHLQLLERKVMRLIFVINLLPMWTLCCHWSLLNPLCCPPFFSLFSTPTPPHMHTHTPILMWLAWMKIFKIIPALAHSWRMSLLRFRLTSKVFCKGILSHHRWDWELWVAPVHISTLQSDGQKMVKQTGHSG